MQLTVRTSGRDGRRANDRQKSILRKVGQTRLNALAGHTIKFSGCTWYEIRIRDRKGPSQGVIHKGEPRERNPCAPKFEETTPEETSRQEECARKAAWNLARNTKLKAEDKATFYSPVKIKSTSASLQKHRRAHVCGGSGSFNTHAEQEGSKPI